MEVGFQLGLDADLHMFKTSKIVVQFRLDGDFENFDIVKVGVQSNTDANIHLTEVGTSLKSDTDIHLMDAGVRFEADADVHLTDVGVLFGTAFWGPWWSSGKGVWNTNVPFRFLFKVLRASKGDTDSAIEAPEPEPGLLFTTVTVATAARMTFSLATTVPAQGRSALWWTMALDAADDWRYVKI